MTQQSSIKLSILVAVKDVASFLTPCLESLHQQTLQDAEFIIVDDGSTDGSLAICRTYVEKDPRFQLMVHERNQGCVVTRLDGFSQSTGKFVMVLDGDDYLSDPKALESIYARAVKEDVDILRLGVSPRDMDGSINQAWQNQLTRRSFYRVTQTSPKEAALVTHLFVKERVSFSLIGVCYRRSVWEAILPYAKREHLVIAEDAYLTFLLMTVAKSYASVDESQWYQYRIGCGVSTSVISLTRFARYARASLVPFWLREFISQYPEWSPEHGKAIDTLEDWLVEDVLTQFRALPRREHPAAMAMLSGRINMEKFYQRVQQLDIPNEVLYRIPARRLFRAWLKSFLGLSKKAQTAKEHTA